VFSAGQVRADRTAPSEGMGCPRTSSKSAPCLRVSIPQSGRVVNSLSAFVSYGSALFDDEPKKRDEAGERVE